MLMGAAGESTKSTSFSVANSGVWNDNDTDRLNVEYEVAAFSKRLFTISFWLKRGNLSGSAQNIICQNRSSQNGLTIQFQSDNTFNVLIEDGSGNAIIQRRTTPVYRDPHAWYHFHIKIDSNQTDDTSCRVYVNGVEETSFGTKTNPSSPTDTGVLNNGGSNILFIGTGKDGSASPLDAYLSEVLVMDGSSLVPTDNTGEFDDNNIWRPIDLTKNTLALGTTDEAIANSASATNSSGLTTYTYSGVALGTASSTRAIYVFATGQGPASSNFDVNSMTIGGVSATRVADVTNSAEAQYVSELWRADVPSGTTGDIVVVWNATMSQCGVIAWAVTGDHFLSNIQTTSDSTASFTLSDIPDGSVILAGRGGTGSRTHGWSSDVTENVDEEIGSGVVQSGASSAKSTGGNFTVTCTPSSNDTRARTVCIVLSPNQGAGRNGFYLPFTDSVQIGADYASGSPSVMTVASEWNGDTGDFSSLDTNIVAIGGNQGAIRTNDTYEGDFAVQFNWQAGSNPAYLGVYEIDEDSTFSSSAADGGLASMTDSFYLFFTSGNSVNAVKGSTTEASGIFTAASSELIKLERSGSTFKVYEDGILRHTFSGTSSNELRLVVAQNSSSMNWTFFKWINGSTNLGNPLVIDGSPAQTTDSPTTNAATFSSLITRHQTSFNGVASDWTFTNGNRTLTHTSGSSGDIMAAASQLLQPGQKYHFEAVTESMHSSAYARFQLALVPHSMWSSDASPLTGTNDQFTFSLIKSGGTGSNTAAFDNGSLTAPTNKPTTNSRLTFEVDMSTIGSTTVRYYFNGSLDTTYSSLGFADEPYYVVSFTGTETDRNGVFNFNFGSSAFTDTPTSGHTGLTAKDAFAGSAPAIEDGSAHFQTTLYTGNGSTQEINQTGNSTFKPDLLWLQGRESYPPNSSLYDSLRSTEANPARLTPNDTQAEHDDNEGTANKAFKSFDADGFSFQGGGNNSAPNANTKTMIGWQWLAGGAPTADNSAGAGATPTAGSVKIDGSNLGSALAGTIPATRLSANTTNGFSIVAYTGTGSNATVAHGLGSVPNYIVVKGRSASGKEWVNYHHSLGNASVMWWNSDLDADSSTNFQSTDPTSTVFSIGTGGDVNTSSVTYMAYCWAEKAGYSKFGKFSSGSSGDPFVECGFTPALIFLKRYSANDSWYVQDTARDPNNPAYRYVKWDSPGTEASNSGVYIDIISNGFVCDLGGIVTSNDDMIFGAWAENPFAGTTPITAR